METIDTIVIGGGPAGLQAALTLGRMHRSVLLLDSGEYRNATVEHFHNFLTQDGADPAALRAAGHAELARYTTVDIRRAHADRVEQTAEGFEVHLADQVLTARTVLLATGVRDELPDVPGLADVWGTLAAACPFCHGHETAGQRVVASADPAHTDRLDAMLSHIGADVVRLDPADLLAVSRDGNGLRLTTPTGDLTADFLFVGPTFTQRAPFAAQLGLDLLPSGCVEVDAFGRTGLPGIFAAGDMAHTAALPMPMASVLVAAANGLVAASATVQHLLTAGQPVADGAAQAR